MNIDVLDNIRSVWHLPRELEEVSLKTVKDDSDNLLWLCEVKFKNGDFVQGGRFFKAEAAVKSCMDNAGIVYITDKPC